MIWNETAVETLKKLWAEGRSVGEIAAELGGVSRNAVIGKAHRLHLVAHVNAPEHGKPIVRVPVAKPFIRTARLPKAKVDPVKVAAVKKMVERTAALPAPAPLNFTLLELNHGDCRWPVSGDGAKTLFCGHNVEAGKSYCACHGRMSVGRGTESERKAVYIGKAA